ncbi:unnamed protein product [Sympodiomycopsis kandeliae]
MAVKVRSFTFRGSACPRRAVPNSSVLSALTVRVRSFARCRPGYISRESAGYHGLRGEFRHAIWPVSGAEKSPQRLCSGEWCPHCSTCRVCQPGHVPKFEQDHDDNASAFRSRQKKLNRKLADSTDEVLILSQNAVQHNCSEVIEDIAHLHKLSEAMAMLDMLVSLGTYSSDRGRTRPEFTGTLAIKNGRHPLLEKMNPSTTIPNDVFVEEPAKLSLLSGRKFARGVRGAMAMYAYSR